MESLPSPERDMVIQVTCEHIRIPVDVMRFYKAHECAMSISGKWSLA